MHTPGETRRRRVATAGLAISLALVAAACGGGGKKSNSSNASATTSTSGVEETTTTAVGTQTSDTTAPGAVAPVTTATSARSSSSGSASKSSPSKSGTATTIKTTQQTLATGISNVVATSTTAPPSNLTPGGTFTYVNASDPASIDGNLMVDSPPSEGLIGAALYDNLMYFNSQNGAVTPSTAESLTSTDGGVWILKIRPGIKFSDGTPYDANAVKFNWNRIADPNTKSALANFVSNIGALDVVDATTLKITLKAKSGVFPNSVASPISWIDSPTAVQKDPNGFASNPVGAGPFIFKSWVRGSVMTLVRNPNYWNAPLPYLDQVVIKPITDETQRLNTLDTGGAQMLWTRIPANKKTAEQAGNIANPLVTNGGTNAYFNTTSAPFKDQRVREAVVRAIDRSDYAKVVNGGAVPTIDSIFAESSPFYDATITQYPYDPVKAQQLFDAAAADNGGPITFEISGFAVQTQQTQAEYLQGVLSKFKNVKVTVQTYAIGAGVTKLTTRDFQMMLAGLYYIDPEPQFAQTFVCAARPAYTGWCDAKFDADMADQKQTLDPNQRIADFKDAQKIFYSAAPSIFYDRGYSWDIVTPQVQNWHFVNDGWALLDNVWLKR